GVHLCAVPASIFLYYGASARRLTLSFTMVYRTFTEARAALDRGETTCEALVSSYLQRIEADNGHLNVFVQVDAEGALERAKFLDEAISRGEHFPLAGLVLAVKDVICIRNRTVTCGSRILQGFTSLFDATVIERLRNAGAIFIGKTNCDEFAMGSSNETSYYGPVRNPVAPEYVPRSEERRVGRDGGSGRSTR